MISQIIVVVFVCVLVLCMTSGCSSSGDSSPISAEKLGEKSAKNDQIVLAKFMIDTWGTEGTLSADYAEVRENHDDSIRNFIARQHDDTYTHSRHMMETRAHQLEFARIVLPPVGLIKYLLYCRMMRNALHCTSTDTAIKDASDMFLDSSFPRSVVPNSKYASPELYASVLRTCEYFHIHPDCSSIAIKTITGILLSFFYGTRDKRTLSSSFLLVQDLIEARFGSKYCSSETQRHAFTEYAKKGIEMFSEKILSPPPADKSMQQHVIDLIMELRAYDEKTIRERNCEKNSINHD